MRIWPAPGTGVSRSSTTSASGGPSSVQTTTRIVSGICADATDSPIAPIARRRPAGNLAEVSTTRPGDEPDGPDDKHGDDKHGDDKGGDAKSAGDRGGAHPESPLDDLFIVGAKYRSPARPSATPRPGRKSGRRRRRPRRTRRRSRAPGACSTATTGPAGAAANLGSTTSRWRASSAAPRSSACSR